MERNIVKHIQITNALTQTGRSAAALNAASLGGPLVMRNVMNKHMKTTIWIALLLLFSTASFKFGIEYGIYQHQITDSSYKAFLAASQLKKIDENEYGLIKAIQQSKLTDEIINYGKYLDHGKPWLFWPRTSEALYSLNVGSMSREEYMKKAIIYRKNHPVKMRYDLSQCTGGNEKSDFCKMALKQQSYYDLAMKN